jgi:hypothetical protein
MASWLWLHMTSHPTAAMVMASLMRDSEIDDKFLLHLQQGLVF